jgi:hypothetical protein
VTGHSLGQLICQLLFLSCSDQITIAKQTLKRNIKHRHSSSPNHAWDALPTRNTSQGLSAANRGRRNDGYTTYDFDP